MKGIKKNYDKGHNVMEYLANINQVGYNTTSSILTSYDLQAGSYRKSVIENNTMDCFLNGERKSIPKKEYLKHLAGYFSKEINQYTYESILEAGIGECTTASVLIPKLETLQTNFRGFDISASRIVVGYEVFNEDHIDNTGLFVADLNHIPLTDNAVDIVYTVHAIEPNTLNATKIIKELYRICSKYVILLEPSYELGNQETKDNIDKHKYIKNLQNIINDLGFTIQKHELFPISSYHNQTAITIIKKNLIEKETKNEFACPICKRSLILHKEHYFCKDCYLVYPVIGDIPMLTKNNGILFSKYLDS